MTFKLKRLFLFLCFLILLLTSCEMGGSDNINDSIINITVVNGTGTGQYVYGATVTVTTEEEKFLYWSIADQNVSTDKTYMFIAKKDVTVVAVLNDEDDPTPPPFNPGFKDEVLSTENVIVYSAPNTLQVLQDDPAPSNINAKLSFEGAIGERETAQLMLYTLKDFDNKTVNLKFTDFYCGDKKIDKSAINAYFELYQDVKTNWICNDDSPNSWYPYGKEEVKTGIYPDALCPLDVAVTQGLNKLNAKIHNNQGLFFVLNIPTTATKGTYVGQIEISISGEKTLVLPVSIKVFGFTMPKENECNTMINIARSETYALYPGENENSIFLQKAWDILAERGISGAYVNGSAWGTNTIDKYVENIKKVVKDNRVPVYNLSPNYSHVNVKVSYEYKSGSIWKTKTEEFSELPLLQVDDEKYNDTIDLCGLKTLFTKLADASSNELNLFKKAIIYFAHADEPSKTSDYIQNIFCQNAVNISRDYVLEHYDWTGKLEVKEALQNIAYIVTSEPNTEMYDGYRNLKVLSYDDLYCGLDNIQYTKCMGYCPLYKNFLSTASTYRTIENIRTNDAYTLWWYGCCQPIPPYPTMDIDSPMIRVRVSRWMEFALGIEGQLYYMCNRTQRYENGTSYPLTEAEILQGVPYEGLYDDGLFIYPVYNLFKAYNDAHPESKIYYLSSIRLESISEGADDYNYLVLATKLINNIKDETLKANYIERLNTIIHSLYNDVASMTKDNTVFVAARRNLVKIIEELYK